MNNASGQLRTSIRLTAVAVFLLATTLTAALAIGLQYYFGQKMARQTASDMYTTASQGIATELDNIGNVNANIMALLASNPELQNRDRQAEQLRIFIKVMEKNPLYYGVYLGRADGSFFEVINLENSEYARQVFRAAPSDRWLVTTVQPGENGPERSFQYLDDELQTRLSRHEPTEFDVLSRPWYQSAINSGGLSTTPPYLFSQLGVAGRTLSQAIGNSGTVIGIDMTMSTISTLLQDNAISGQSEIYLYNAAGEVMASSLAKTDIAQAPPVPVIQLTQDEQEYIAALPTLKVSNELDWPPFDFALSGEPQGYSIDVINMLAKMTGLKVRFVNGYSWPELKEQYQRGDIDLLQSVILNEPNRGLGLPGVGYAKLPYAIATNGRPSGLEPPFNLEGKTLAIPAGWSVIPLVRQAYPSVTIIETGTTLQSLEMVAAGTVDAALDNKVIMEYLSRHYFLGPFEYHDYSKPGGGELPETLHIFVPEDKPELRNILDKAIAAIGQEHKVPFMVDATFKVVSF